MPCAMAAWLKPSHPPLIESEIGVAILGAGFAGICMAIKLKEQGRADFRIFEKASSLGGTWRDNTYPGCACDVPSHLYSYSFDQNPDWSRTYATQPEILAYLRRVAANHAIDQQILFDTPIKAIAWTNPPVGGGLRPTTDASSSPASWSPPLVRYTCRNCRTCPGSVPSRGPRSTPPIGGTISILPASGSQ